MRKIDVEKRGRGKTSLDGRSRMRRRGRQVEKDKVDRAEGTRWLHTSLGLNSYCLARDRRVSSPTLYERVKNLNHPACFWHSFWRLCPSSLRASWYTVLISTSRSVLLSLSPSSLRWIPFDASLLCIKVMIRTLCFCSVYRGRRRRFWRIGVKAVCEVCYIEGDIDW